MITLSLSLTVSPSYSSYDILSEADYFSPDLVYENSDQEDLSFDYQNKSNGLGSEGFSAAFLPAIDLIRQGLHFSFQTYPLDKNIFVLRC
jgi:hypothetical protein